MRRRLSMLAMAIWLISTAAVAAEDTHGTSDKANREEYKPTAEQTPLLRSDLEALPGNEANIVRMDFPAGWTGGKHYHTGDVFLYILEGELVLDVEGQDPQTLGPGKAYHESVEKVMTAHNPSTTQAAKVIIFQVGAKDEPLMIKAE